jgi:translation initiation factor IF-3
MERRGPFIRPEPKQDPTRINERIRVPEVRVIGSDGSQVGVLPIEQALRMAKEANLDLVEIAPLATPPVVKITDYGKYKYDIQRKERLARKKQTATVLKGIRLTATTDDHDLMTKVKLARTFVIEGAKVKCSIMFRGRMITHQEFGTRMLERMATELADVAKVESPAKMEGPRMMTMILIKK